MNLKENLLHCYINIFLFFLSALEGDVTRGIFDTRDPRSHCLCYRREYRDIMSHLDKPESHTYVDMVGMEVDKELRASHHRLADQVSKHLGVGAFKPYYLKWPEQGGDPQQTEEYKAYLDNLCHDFVTDIKHLIVQGVEKLEETRAQPGNIVYPEVLHHAHLCKEKMANFTGQSDVLFRVERFLKDPRQNNKPFVLFGSPGCGKSAVMAAVASNIREWFTPDSVVITRFLNTTSESSNIHQTVISVTLQICLVYGIRVPSRKLEMDTLFRH